MREAIPVPGAPRAIGPYSPVIRAGNLLFVSGQIPFNAETGTVVTGDIEHLVRTTVFLMDMNDFAAMNEAYAKYMTDPPPARSTVQVARLPRDARIEIDAIAVLP